jgi:hypothetical protein
MADARDLIAPPPPPPPPGPPPGPPLGPPPGPGVQPPFVVAPIEGRRARTWLSLGVAGGLLAACCGVGGVAIGGLLVLGTEAVNEQAQTAVGDYLTALVEQDWEQAYELRCEDDREDQSLAEFTQRESTQPQIEVYEVGDLDTVEMTVPVRVTYADGTGEQLAVPVEQSSQTGRFEVCGSIE